MTCLVLTKDRPLWLPYAIQCARHQNYPNKEILILADGQDVAHLIPNDPAIRYEYRPHFGSIGTKRNAGCEIAAGEIIFHIDDDDYSAPGRLADQVTRLIESDCQVTGYHRCKLTDGRRWWRYNGEPHYAIGASLCYWRSYWEAHRFPDKQVGEDGDFVMRARTVLAAADAGDLMYYTVHSGNTSPRQLNTKQYQEIPA